MLNTIIKKHNVKGIIPMRKDYDSYLKIIELVIECYLKTLLTEKDYRIITINGKNFLKITNWKAQHQLDKEIDITLTTQVILEKVEQIKKLMKRNRSIQRDSLIYSKINKIKMYNMHLIKLGAEPIKTKWTA